jgi:prepilin-type N-terminal cleavage/methylation domain-containing protein
MLSKTNRQPKGGFTLLELTVVLIIVTILTSAVIPQFINAYTVKAANKTALDMSAIIDASNAYYTKYNIWPGVVSGNAIGDLTAGNYLPSSWQAINPFGFSSASPTTYAYNFTLSGPGPGAALWISTHVPNTSALTLIKNSLPASWIDSTNNIVYTSVSSPGIPPNVVPSGAILAYSGTTAPYGFLLCDGTNYPDSVSSTLAAIYGVSGTSTFTVPDLRGRTIVGLNPLTTNDGSIRIWSTDSNDNLGSSFPYANVRVINGVFGEERHRQNILELAPHSHTYLAPPPQVHGFSGESTTAPRGNDYTANTSTTGGDGTSSTLGAPSNVVLPSVTMQYIIKI